MNLKRILLCCLAAVLVFGTLLQPVHAQEPSPLAGQEILDRMSPAEKIGQLFVVSYDGPRASMGSEIYRLVQQKYVGGVILAYENDNFLADGNLVQTRELVNSLQRLAWQAAQSPNPVTPGEPQTPFLPLLVGVEQPDLNQTGGYFIEGLSVQPPSLAIGASWSLELARQAGELLGAELSALGINLLIGPKLDVLETEQTEGSGISASGAFGGSPYWVGEMGRAFTTGLHTGSENRLAVFAGHFPGLGAADRPIGVEVSSVQKSIEELQSIDLVPFSMAVEGLSGGVPEGMQVSHIRYNGFQGNLQITTKPVSFDQTAMEQILAWGPLPAWREAGGLTMSDSLGNAAVRAFFDPTGQSFDILTVARTSFLAGNDLLYLNNFSSSADTAEYDAIVRTHQFFVQKYNEDKFFAQKVDSAVLRIIKAKVNLNPDLTLEAALAPEGNLNEFGKNSQVASDAALNGVALVSPGANDLKASLPQAPSLQDRLIIFTDEREFLPCSGCTPRKVLDAKAFQDALLRYYGPQGTRQLTVGQISAYSSLTLLNYLNQNEGLFDQTLPESLSRANWVIFNLQNKLESSPESRVLQTLLSEQPELLLNKRVIVFAFGEPYYLDSTEISKLTAYYALYGNSQPFIDAAARILMQELNPRTALPIDLSAVRYDLKAQTSPDPRQVIPVNLMIPMETLEQVATEAATVTSEAPQPLFRFGELVKIQAGPIIDMNGNQVPDGTEVVFNIKLAPENFIIVQPKSATKDGLATIDYRIDREGIFEITASSGQALSSNTLVLNTEGGLAQVIMPTPTPTPVPTQTVLPSATSLPTEDPLAKETPLPPGIPSGYPRMGDWLLVIMILILGAGLAFGVAYYWWGGSTWGMRALLTSFIGGLLAYTLLTIGIGPVVQLVQEGGSWFIAQSAMIGLFFGWIVALVWWLKTGKN